jgi:cytochrome c-type biogenesis protein CcmH/NrfG
LAHDAECGAGLGNAMMKLGDAVGALRSYRTAIRLNPHHPG